MARATTARPAGFRTHALVCLASALLMLVSVYQWRWFVGTPLEAIRTDPTRMAQGIMTGIGFLGAGVIFKEGLTVRGLTTAASIWITATLGVLYGVGFYFPAVLATIATLGVLGGFRWFENRMPSQIFAHLDVRYPRDRVPDAAAFRALLRDNGFSTSAIRHSLIEDDLYEFRTMIRTTDRAGADRLAAVLLQRDDIDGFTLEPAGD